MRDLFPVDDERGSDGEPLGSRDDIGFPGEFHVHMMAIKAAYPSKSRETIAGEANVQQSGTASILRRSRKGDKLQSGTEEQLRTHAEIQVLGSSRLGLDLETTALREAIVRCVLTDLTSYYLPNLHTQVGRLDHDPRKKTWYGHLILQAHFRLAREHGIPKDRAENLAAAVKANKALLDAAKRAGSNVSPLYLAIALTNEPALQWEELLEAPGAVERDVLVDMCTRGREACHEAAEQFWFWIRPRRDAIEYTALLLHLGKAFQKELELELLRLARAFKGSSVLDVLLMLRANMEPAALKMIKASAVYKRLVEANAQRQSPRVTITSELIRQLEKEIGA